MTRVLVLNGPNLGRLGRRQPEIYGSTTHAELAHQCVEWGRGLGLEVEVRQTNHEGELLDWLKLLVAEDIPLEALQSKDDKVAVPPLVGALLKNEQDVTLFEKLVFMQRNNR